MGVVGCEWRGGAGWVWVGIGGCGGDCYVLRTCLLKTQKLWFSQILQTN